MSDLYHGPYPVDMTPAEALLELQTMRPFTPSPRSFKDMKFLLLTDAQDNSHVYVNVAFIRSFVRDGDHTTLTMGEELIYWVKEPAETIADFLKEMGIDIPVWIGA